MFMRLSYRTAACQFRHARRKEEDRCLHNTSLNIHAARGAYDIFMKRDNALHGMRKLDVLLFCGRNKLVERKEKLLILI